MKPIDLAIMEERFRQIYHFLYWRRYFISFVSKFIKEPVAKIVQIESIEKAPGTECTVVMYFFVAQTNMKQYALYKI